jgi:hypothetical protein
VASARTTAALPAEAGALGPEDTGDDQAAVREEVSARSRPALAPSRRETKATRGPASATGSAAFQAGSTAADFGAARSEAAWCEPSMNSVDAAGERRVLVRHTPWIARRLHDPILPTTPVRIGAPDSVRQLRLRLREELNREPPPLIRPPETSWSVVVRSRASGGSEAIRVDAPLPIGPRAARDERDGSLAHVEVLAAGVALLTWRDDVAVFLGVEVQVDEASSMDPSAWEWRLTGEGMVPVTLQPMSTHDGRYLLKIPVPDHAAKASTRTLSLVHRSTDWSWSSDVTAQPNPGRN